MATRLIEGLSRKMWTGSTGFRVGGVKTDLFNHEKHERHEKQRFSSVSCFSWLIGRLGFRCVRFFLGIILLLGLGGCATYPTTPFKLWNGTASTESPCPLVKYPTGVGGGVGFVAGFPFIPIGIAVTDSTYWVMGKKQDESALFYKLSPAFGLGFAVGNLVGAPCWALFGWWWPKDDYQILKPERPERKREEKPETGQTDLWGWKISERTE